ncbi:hypothetical protein [Sphingopyxis sp.]|jgi:hypothetical protein|uniref:hypothetical protein n=1 Tax=Sphingopyxis sp. TaxID=1908224 RepID=UPI002DEF02B6|nr:hypothetical protein [Sphingopyxis sp.]
MNVTVLSPLPSFGPQLAPTDMEGTGALIIDTHSLPEADASVIETENGKIKIQIQYFEEYLRFLELICWCEEAVIGVMPLTTMLPPKKITRKLIKSCGKFGQHSGIANIQEKAISRLTEEKIIKTRALTSDPDALRPDIYVRRLLAASPSYRENFRPGIDLSNWTEEDEKSLIWYTMHHGNACALTDFAQRAKLLSHIPIVSHNVDIEALDDVENRIQASIVAKIADRLSAGAKKEVEALEVLGTSIQLPPSPVAAHILREAKNKEDLILVALQLRDNLKEIRHHLNGLQSTMLDEDVSVDKRIRVGKEIQRLMLKLSPTASIDTKKSIQSYSSFVENIKDSILDSENFTIKKATDIIISKPIEYIIDRFRYRKYRVLFDMKNKFLSDKSYHSRICSILGYKMSDQDVSISLDYCGHAKLNSYRHDALR